MHLEELEFAEDQNCYVLGFIRGEAGVLDYGFVGKLINHEIQQTKKLPRWQFDYASAYKYWERCGFTPKALEWSCIKQYDDKPKITLKELHASL